MQFLLGSMAGFLLATIGHMEWKKTLAKRVYNLDTVDVQQKDLIFKCIFNREVGK